MSIWRTTGRFGLPTLAGLGLGVALATARMSSAPPPIAQPIAEPAAAPFPQFLAGAGIIESLGRNVDVATPVGGVIAEVAVAPGQRVRKGDPLYILDTRDLAAERGQRQAQLVTAAAKVHEAETSLEDYRNQLSFAQGVTLKGAVSAEELAKRRSAVTLAEAKVATARADLAAANADLGQTKTNIERRTVRAPIDGQVLQLNARPGQYAPTGESTSLAVIGRVDRLAVRIDIDENDAWQFEPGQPGRAFLRGNRDLFADLTFESLEPYVRPKTSLSGSSTERVDTRVLQVVFSFPAGMIPAYVGQQVDAFIRVDAGRLGQAAARVAGPRPHPAAPE